MCSGRTPLLCRWFTDPVCRRPTRPPIELCRLNIPRLLNLELPLDFTSSCASESHADDVLDEGCEEVYFGNTVV